MRRLLLFDIDGTLVDVAGAGRAAVGRAMREVFGETGPVETFEFHGKTDPGIVRGLLREAGRSGERVEERMERLWEAYLAALEEELEERREAGRVRPYPGVAALLDRLDADGRFVRGLLTGNVEEGAWRKLEAGGLADRFAFGAFGSDSPRRGALPPIALERAARHAGREFGPAETVVIGDTAEDIRCAREWGMSAVAVATGRPALPELRAHEPDRLLRDLSDTAAVVEALADPVPAER